MRNDILSNPESADIVLPLTKDSLVKALKTELDMSGQEGIIRALRDNKIHGAYQLEKISSKLFDDLSSLTITNMAKDILKGVKKAESSEIGDIIDNVEYRLRFLIEFIIPKIYWYNYVKTCASVGVDKVYIKFNGSDDADDHSSVIHTKNFSWEDIPAFHSYCDCEISLTKPEGGEAA